MKTCFSEGKLPKRFCLNFKNKTPPPPTLIIVLVFNECYIFISIAKWHDENMGSTFSLSSQQRYITKESEKKQSTKNSVKFRDCVFNYWTFLYLDI